VEFQDVVGDESKPLGEPPLQHDAGSEVPVRHVVAEDALLFLWVINPMLQAGLDVMKAWGFEFSTVAFTWAKTTRSSDPAWNPKWHFGMGYWTRSNAEICLLGVRGTPKRINADVRQLVVAPVREHSRKPDEVYTSIERLCGGPRLELFGRQSRPGWDVRGLEATKFDQKAAPRLVPAPPVRFEGPTLSDRLAKLRRTTGHRKGIPRLLAVDDVDKSGVG
jgi:N6-adenosine-specific RNA methylase IME4